MGDVGARFVAALAAKDRDALRALFADPVSFRGLTPGRSWEASTPEAVVDDILMVWFAAGDHVEAVVDLATGSPSTARGSTTGCWCATPTGGTPSSSGPTTTSTTPAGSAA